MRRPQFYSTKMKPLITILTIAAFAAPMIGNAEDTTKAKPYPLKVCVVSNEGLDEMGGPTTIVYEGQEVKFCCKKCVKKFNADPAKYMKVIQEAEKK